MVLNPNFPVVEDAWGPSWGAGSGALPTSKWVDLTNRTQAATAIKRGKQYELDAIQSGQYDAQLNNQDGALDPMNSSGPWGGSIRPYQPLRHQVQWPPTANRLAKVLATGGDGYSAGTIPPSFGITSATDSTGGSIVVLGSGVAYEESNAFQFAVPSTAPGYAQIFTFDAGSIQPGTTYTFSAWLRNVTASTMLAGYLQIGWITSPGGTPNGWTGNSVTLAGSATAPWARVTATGTAPASCYGAVVTFALPATWAANTCTLQADGLQFEIGSAATAWGTPGTWYPLFSGYVERWPSEWADNGTRGIVKPTGVDALALLSQITLKDAVTHEYAYLTPRFCYTLSDPIGSTSANDSTGNNRPLQLISNPTGAGSIAFGTAITSAAPPAGTFAGVGTVFTFNNPGYGVPQVTNNTYYGATLLSLDQAGIKGPTNPQEWSRTISFRWTGGTFPANGQATIWGCSDTQYDGVVNGGSFIALTLTQTSLSLGVNAYRNQLNPPSVTTTGSFADGNWHHVVFGVSVSGSIIMLAVDGVYQTSSMYGAAAPTGLVWDTIGQSYDPTQTYADFTFRGDVAYAAEFSSALSAAQITAMYSGWRNAGQGESSDARYKRLLRYAGFTGVATVDAGVTQSMGAANNIAGQDALSALQAVVDTEMGEHHVNGDGSIRFMSRGTRYLALAPQVTFGDGPGEYPYEELQLDFDPTHLANQITITQESTGATFSAADATSIANYYPRVFTRTINTTNALECQDCANYVLGRYKNSQTRVTALKLNPGANTALWPAVLGLELGTRIRVMRRPFGAPAIQVDCFVQNIAWDFTDKGEAFLTLQCSPVDPQPSGVLGIWRSLLSTQASAGTSVLTISALLDTTNVLAAQVGQGQTLVIDPGTSIAETVTVSAVGATGSPWTTGTITLAANLAYTHLANAIVSEPYPAGANGSIYDTASTFDSVVFAY